MYPHHFKGRANLSFKFHYLNQPTNPSKRTNYLLDKKWQNFARKHFRNYRGSLKPLVTSSCLVPGLPDLRKVKNCPEVAY